MLELKTDNQETQLGGREVIITNGITAIKIITKSITEIKMIIIKIITLLAF